MFREESVRVTLRNFLDPFPSASTKSKSAFQTKTAAINATPISNGDYDIEQIKADAQWLSENSKIDEIGALRIVVLDWQQSAFGSHASSFTSGQHDEPTSSKSFIGPAANSILGLEKEGAFNELQISASATISKDIRRSRQKYLLEDEKSYILRVAVELMSVALSSNVFNPITDSVAPSNVAPGLPGWLHIAATEILNERNYGQINKAGIQAIIKLMEAFGLQLKRLIEEEDPP